MGMTIWVNLRNGAVRESNEQDHSVMLKAEKHLDKLADKLLVPRLSSFQDDTDLRYNMDESGEFEESEEGWPNDRAQWFDPAQGLRAVTAIIDHLRINSAVVKRQAELIEELEDCKAELEKAMATNRTFHFCLVM